MDRDLSVTRSAYGPIGEASKGVLPEDFPDQHDLPRQLEDSACPVCGELPPGAAEHAWWSWAWDAGEAHRHDEPLTVSGQTEGDQ